jgi:hypothetical protein
MQDQIQITNEYRYSQQSLNEAIRDAILGDPVNAAKVTEGEESLKDWLAGSYYPKKDARLAQLDPLSLHDIVMDVFVSIAYCLAPVLYVSVTSKLAAKMGFDNHRDSIVTIAEIVAVLCATDAYDVTKESVRASLMVVNNLNLPEDLVDRIEGSHYVPPLVCAPKYVHSNYESAYLTFNDSLILGPNNGHNEDICLDVINLQNQIPLQLCVPFLEEIPEEPTHALDTIEKTQQWGVFKSQSTGIYQMLHDQGNEFYLANKVDKRGRMYAHGYHVTTQGSPFKKAMVELAHKERVEGVTI